MIARLFADRLAALLALPAAQFKLILDSIVWAFKHTHREIMDIGLNICLELLTNIAQSDPSIRNGFYHSYYLSLLQDVFFVLTDRDHKSGFKLQSLILAHLVSVVDGLVTTPLYDPATSVAATDNTTFLRDYIVNLLATAFPHLQAYVIL